jgi:hypothetical protein
MKHHPLKLENLTSRHDLAEGHWQPAVPRRIRLTDGGTRKAKGAQAMVSWGKHVGVAPGKSGAA